jgi:hypothetical protein
MEEKELSKAYFNSYILVLVGIAYVIGMLALALKTNLPEPKVHWNMGGTQFVPAAADEARGYYAPVQTNEDDSAEEEQAQ